MNDSQDTFLSYGIANVDDPVLLPSLKEINETVETKSESLEILRREFQNYQDIEPYLEENFLLRYLRVSKFDTSRALQRILKYYHHQDKLLNALKKISIPLQKARTVNYRFLSPYRTKDNSCLIFACPGKIDHSQVSLAEILYLDVLAINKILENPVNQIAGATVMLDYGGFNFNSYLAYTPKWCLMVVETLTNALPARIKALHLVNTPSLFWIVYNIVYPFLPKKIKERVFIHSSDDGWKSLHAAIPPEILPKQNGGYLEFDSCINILDNVEELDDSFRKTLKYGYIKTKSSRLSFKFIT